MKFETQNISTYLVIFLLSLFLYPNTAHASDGADCYQFFYQTKDLSCISAIIAMVPKAAAATNDGRTAVNPGFLGFFAKIFSTYPQEKERILAGAVPLPTKLLFVEALYEANLQEEAQAYADASGLPQVVKHMQSIGLVPLEQMKPAFVPADNDMLIGAYTASGNTEYIKRILDNFTSASDDMVADALRLSMMQGKFGPTLSPAGREATIMNAACQKYECKKDVHNLMRVLTLSSAFWATRSLSQHDEAIKKTFNDFFEHDPRLKQIITIEGNAFANYLTTLAVFAAIKNNPNIESALSIYENLGSGKEAADAVVGNKGN